MTNPHKGLSGWRRAFRASVISTHGIATALRTESAFRQEAALAVVMLPTSLWLGRNWVEVALLAGSVVGVLIVELLNSAVEAAVDRVSYEMHELSGRAKDFGSAAVMLSLITCGAVWSAAIYRNWLS